MLHGLHGKLGKKRIFDSMLEHFLSFIRKHDLVHPDQRLLLAVSGGLDSMVMLHLFHQSGFKPAVAHCNFQLRAEDSIADAEFVSATCKQLGLPFFVKAFDTKNYATEKGFSIQMAARDLRYTWFNDLMKTHNFDRLATAHHLNDNLETVLLNFVRGTGIEGLCGIPLVNGKIIRPLLFAKRTDIAAYAAEEGITWREDASNQTSNYQRNYLRHKVLPLLADLNPELEHTFLQNLERLEATKYLLHDKLSKIKTEIVQKEKDLYIPKSIFSDANTQILFIWEILKEAGFNWVQANAIAQAMNHTGAVFHANEFKLNVDRDHLILTKTEDQLGEILIYEDTGYALRGDEHLSLERVLPPAQFDHPVTEALFDFESLHFPLTWRTWQEGDRFMPLGMTGMKKVSDFLIDAKIPLINKNRVAVLEDASGHIIWLMGLRIDERFKVNQESKSLLKLKLT
jgi:tRNA(Ile)-lysidine synthase